MQEVIVCESILNALTLRLWKTSSLIRLNEYQYNSRKLRIWKIITALDPDAAGQRATARLKKALNGSKLVTSYIIPEGKDINDLTKKEFENLQELF